MSKPPISTSLDCQKSFNVLLPRDSRGRKDGMVCFELDWCAVHPEVVRALTRNQKL